MPRRAAQRCVRNTGNAIGAMGVSASPSTGSGRAQEIAARHKSNSQRAGRQLPWREQAMRLAFEHVLRAGRSAFILALVLGSARLAWAADMVNVPQLGLRVVSGFRVSLF